ncbi:hypothetical protein SAMN04487764_2577 [Gillisia sp. Hel1_33_143]|uniref:hypothetical protein n=1 Tax=unclassified Gillisia TaxID=2615025 RepID=UPI00054D2147|nr:MULTISPECIES: hypothetical protein [unclassified Gillisia]SDS59441.1 hypothetical protein SAMN04487764_2577 [Gillisia sp. Hel1_33_143]
MAEIKIRKKSPIWPWILLVLIILAALWYFFIYLDTADIDDADEVDDLNTEQIDDESYNSEDNTNSDAYSETDSTYNTSGSNQLSSQPVTTTIADANKSMIDLIDAVRTKSLQTKVTVNNDLKAQREKLVKTTSSTSESSWMNTMKSSGDQIIAAMQTLQKEKYPQLTNEVTSAQNSLQMVDASKTFEDQKARIDTFIRDVVTTLNKMQ